MHKWSHHYKGGCNGCNYERVIILTRQLPAHIWQHTLREAFMRKKKNIILSFTTGSSLIIFTNILNWCHKHRSFILQKKNLWHKHFASRPPHPILWMTRILNQLWLLMAENSSLMHSLHFLVLWLNSWALSTYSHFKLYWMFLSDRSHKWDESVVDFFPLWRNEKVWLSYLFLEVQLVNPV